LDQKGLPFLEVEKPPEIKNAEVRRGGAHGAHFFWFIFFVRPKKMNL
jgi:hypothetical protein